VLIEHIQTKRLLSIEHNHLFSFLYVYLNINIRRLVLGEEYVEVRNICGSRVHKKVI
jgi:hypothetical protein